MQSFIACYVNCYLYYDRNGARKSYRGDDFEQEKERGREREGEGGRERKISLLFYLSTPRSVNEIFKYFAWTEAQ